jgi:hypothetical protein
VRNSSVSKTLVYDIIKNQIVCLINDPLRDAINGRRIGNDEEAMKIIKYTGLGALMIGIALLISALLPAAAPPADAEQSSQNVKHIKGLNGKGWDVLDIQDAELIDSDVSNLQDLAVIRKAYKLKQRFYTEDGFYSSYQLGNITIENGRFAAKDFVSYSFEEKIFAYRIIYMLIASNDEGDSTTVGPPLHLYFEDKDGDGKFESRYEEPNFPKKAPDWVIKLQN